MPLLKCGCWEGTWALNIQRPMCEAHGGAYGSAARRLANQLRGSAPSREAPKVATLLPQLIAAVHAEAGAAEALDNFAGFDAWQQVIHTLRQLREQVARAQRTQAVEVPERQE